MRTYFVKLLAGISKRTRPVAASSPSKRRITFCASTLAALAALAPMAVTPPLAAQSAPAISVETTTHYAVGQRACKPAAPGHMTCFAMRRVEATANTPGAMQYEPAAGARRSDATAGPSATIGPAGGLTPSDLANAYSFSSTATGKGMTVAIVDAYNDPSIEADLQTFDTQYGLATCTVANGCLTIVGQTGSTTALPADDTTGWSTEISLDVETVHSVCQNCKIILVEANSESDADLGTAENEAVTLKANVISNSYGGPEVGSNSTFEAAYNHPGTVIVASAGDDGYYDYDLLGGDGLYNQPNTPASLNTVVAVGGTSLYLGQDATRQSESVWNDNGTKDYYQEIESGYAFGATGGGCSTMFNAPLWQSNLSNWASTACGSNRLVSDVAAVADYLTGLDIYLSYNCGGGCSTGWQTIGGTSLAAPLISAMYGLAGGAQGVKYPALTLYGYLGTSSLYNVTSGGNGWCDGEGAAGCGDPNTAGDGILDCDYPASGTTPSVGDTACDAGLGFNGPTGVGTPNGLAPFTKTGPAATIAGPTSVASGASNSWTATTTDPFPGGKVTSYSWNWGDGSAATATTTGSANHAYAAAGAYTFTLTLTDNYSMTGTKTYQVTVTGGTPAALTSPAPGSVLAGSSVAFTWSGGVDVSEYELWIGSSGVGSSNLNYPGVTTGTTETVSGLPTNGETLYVRLYSKVSGVWQYHDYTYTAERVPGVLTTPSPGSTFASTSVAFSWTAGTGATEYELWVGTTGVGSSNLNYPGVTTSLTETVSDLPASGGGTVYVRLYSKIGGAWVYHDYTYKAE